VRVNNRDIWQLLQVPGEIEFAVRGMALEGRRKQRALADVAGAGR
jgi:hypothetical protein